MKKRFFVIVLTLIMVFAVGLVGCKANKTEETANTSQSQQTDNSGDSNQNGSNTDENSNDQSGKTDEGSQQGSQGSEQGSEQGGQSGDSGSQGGQGEQGEGSSQDEGSGDIGSQNNDDYAYALFVQGEEGHYAFSGNTLKKTLKSGAVVTVKNADGDTLEFVDWAGVKEDGEYTFEIKNDKVEVITPDMNRVYEVYANGQKKYEFKTNTYSFKLTLSDYEKVEIKTGETVKFETSFVAGTYLFKVTNGDVSAESVKSESQKITVYYSNSNKWQGDIYAYCWNDATKENNAAWPGVKCAYVSTNEFGESIYSYEADASKYDRIIFNNNSNQTKNLSLNDASLGYYGDAGVYAYGKDDYGKSEKITLEDSVNLAYRGGSKKIYVYTPAGYDPSKKYGVLVMFDAQNIFAHVEEVTNQHGAWAVDVAITSLMANRKDWFDGVIVLGIDNGDSYRNSELTMAQTFGTLDPRLTEGESDVEGFYKGHLDDLGDFILDTALPYVSEHYSTNGTIGICGSSSGGLAAYYLGLRDREIYSYIGAFSPAVGLFVKDSWEAFYEEEHFAADAALPELFVYCGSGDGYLEDMLLDGTKEIKSLLVEYGYPAEYIEEYYTENSEHTELWWRIVFSAFAAAYLK